MTRQPTPANILDNILTTDVAPDRTALRSRLRWNYAQVAPVDRKAVEDAAVDILANGQRMQQSAVAVGERLIAVKRLLGHGQFGDWCTTEFSMSQKTAENLMNVAREFGDKIETVSIFTNSAMYMLAAPSTPEPARQQAIAEAQATGKSPTKERVREIIAEHKPGPAVPPIPTPTAKEYAAAVQASEAPAAPARPSVYSILHTPPVPGWDDDDDAEYQALLPTWQQPAGQFNAIIELDRITRRRVAERMSLERLDNLRHSLQERRRELWQAERRQERSASAISNPQSPISNPAPVVVAALPPADAPLPAWADEPPSISKPGQSVADYLAYRDGAWASGMAAMDIRQWRDWLDAQEPAPVVDAEPAPPANAYAALTLPDGRVSAARHLMALYGAVIDSEEQYGSLTGRFSDTLGVKRDLTHMIAHLADLIAAIEHPEEVTPDA